MRVTVCQLPDEAAALGPMWEQLAAHVAANSSELVLLPEMPFSPWFGAARNYDAGVWRAAVRAHDAWERRLADLNPAIVLGTRPKDAGDRRFNEGFVWEPGSGMRAARAKAYLPNEEGVWEANWYHAAAPEFSVVEAGAARVGFLICTELWAMEQARRYGEQGVHLLVTPRLTVAATLDKWLAAGRTAAVVAGAFGLSSNRVADGCHVEGDGAYGGMSWIVGPDGDVLATTTTAEPFATVNLDLAHAEQAKRTYPRYVFERRS